MFGCYLLAIVPGIVLIYIVKNKDIDIWEVQNMSKRFLLGGLFAIVAAIILEDFLSECFLIEFASDSIHYRFVDDFIIPALCEESVKFIIFIMMIKKFFDRYCFYDDCAHMKVVKYCFYLGMSFAIIENLMYAMDADYVVMIMRMLLCLPGHGMYAVIMGDFYYKYKESDNAFYLLCALFIPMIQHGIYDFCIGSDSWVIIILALVNEIYLYKIAYKRICVLGAHSKDEFWAYNSYIS